MLATLIQPDPNVWKTTVLGSKITLVNFQISSVGIFVKKKRIRVFFLLKAKTHLILLDDTINMKKN